MSDQPHPEEYYKKLAEHANKLALKKPDLNLLRNHPTGEYSIMAQALETLLQERDAKRLLVLPNLTAFSNDALGVFSDYSGEDHSARYLTYSVLVCGYRYTGAFSHRMKGVRETYKLCDNLAGDGVGLKKAVFLIRLNTEGNIESASINFSLVNPPVRTFVPIYD